MEERIVVEPVLIADPPAVLEDLRRVRILLRGHVAGFFQERHIDEGGGIAHGAGITVPVPGAAEIAPLLDDADVFHALLHKPRPRHQACVTAADERHRHVVGFRFTLLEFDVGVIQIVRQLIFDPDVLGVAIRPEALVPLLHVLLFERFLIDHLLLYRLVHCSTSLSERLHEFLPKHGFPASGGRSRDVHVTTVISFESTQVDAPDLDPHHPG